MKRDPEIRLQRHAPRAGWRRRVEEAGLVWHGAGTDSYWVEDEHLALTLAAAEKLEAAANELHALCLAACGEIVRRDWFGRMGIPDAAVPMVETSWHCRDEWLYGRFDLAWNGEGEPKLLEYNADTPTSLLEAAVIQWQWLEDTHPQDDQLNSLHEALIERWAALPERTIHFACAWENEEDRQTIAYLAETAEQAGKEVELMDMGEIGFSEGGVFTDPSEREIAKLFKLYPWEWMAEEPFFEAIGQERSKFLEPPWKMMLSNKAILPLLWELNPRHPNLVPAAFSELDVRIAGARDWVSKPFFGREGRGVAFRGEVPAAAEPGAGPLVWQERVKLFEAGGRHFVWGLWMTGDECRALSVRGDASPVTGNLSRFYPHRIVGS